MFAILLAAIPASAQTGESARITHVKLPQWDVISVKPAQPQSCPLGSGIRTTGDGLNAFCVRLLFVIETAYRIMEPSRVIGAPEWVVTGQEWSIDGKVAEEDVATFSNLSRDDSFACCSRC